MNAALEKTCKRCERSKPVAAFNKHPQTKDRLDQNCKECKKIMARENYRRRREREQLSANRLGQPTHEQDEIDEIAAAIWPPRPNLHRLGLRWVCT